MLAAWSRNAWQLPRRRCRKVWTRYKPQYEGDQVTSDGWWRKVRSKLSRVLTVYTRCSCNETTWSWCCTQSHWEFGMRRALRLSFALTRNGAFLPQHVARTIGLRSWWRSNFLDHFPHLEWIAGPIIGHTGCTAERATGYWGSWPSADL